MTKKPKFNSRIKILISSFLGLMFFWFWFGLSLEQTTIELANFIADKYINLKNSDKTTFWSFLGHFCNKTTNITGTNDPKYSVFLFLLCKESGFERSFEVKQWTEEYITNFSLPDIYNDTEKYIQQAFDKTISSYMSIYQASIYGYTSSTTKSKELSKYFSQKNFNFGADFLDICATDKIYSYPKTCSTLKSYQKWAKSLISKKNNILDNEVIFKEFSELETSDKAGNMIIDWLYSDDFWDLITLVYNELFFYSLFVEYYANALNQYSFFKNRWVTKFDEQISNNQDRIKKLYTNLEKSNNAITMTLDYLAKMSSTFPIHIWLSLYKEDIHRFNWAIVKILTPIDVLQHTLRNVQTTN